MSGGISQLVATGAQDVHLVGDPQVSFFRSNYKRHTNFSAIRARQVIQGGNVRNTVGTGNTTATGMSTVRFEKKGDLLSYTYLTKVGANGTVDIGLDDINYVELYIGGQLVDTQYSDYSNGVWTKLEANSYSKVAAQTDFYPLHFFFCDNWTNALPLVALQYHDVEIRIYWQDANTSTADGAVECWSNFIYLDEAERSYFAENTQSMLIKQTQRSQATGKSMQPFNFNHPVLYIGSSTSPAAICTDGGAMPATEPIIQFNINGVQSGDAMRMAPHFVSSPGYYHAPDASDGSVFCVPFALNLCSNQPSGSLNFSRLDSSRLEVQSPNAVFDDIAAAAGRKTPTAFYAVNWNVLKIENGMGGLMYSN